eukprot:749057-Hanusia_phi.AAC.2
MERLATGAWEEKLSEGGGHEQGKGEGKHGSVTQAYPATDKQQVQEGLVRSTEPPDEGEIPAGPGRSDSGSIPGGQGTGSSPQRHRHGDIQQYLLGRPMRAQVLSRRVWDRAGMHPVDSEEGRLQQDRGGWVRGGGRDEGPGWSYGGSHGQSLPSGRNDEPCSRVVPGAAGCERRSACTVLPCQGETADHAGVRAGCDLRQRGSAHKAQGQPPARRVGRRARACVLEPARR